MPLFSALGEAYQFDWGHEIVLLAGVTVKVAHFRLIHSRVMFVAAYDEIIITAIELQHEPPRVVGDLLSVAIAKNQALDHVSARVAKLRWPRTSLPLRRHAHQRDARARPRGVFVTDQRNAVFIGGTGTGMSHWPSRSPARPSAVAPAAGSTTSSIWPTAWRPSAAPANRDAPPTT